MSGRLIKKGLDYFPMDVEIDDKIELIEAKHGITGFGILVKLFQKIYKDEGYYMNCTEETLLIFSKRINVNINTINDVINDCLKYGIFDNNKFEQYKILTSNGIQKRYLNAAERRKEIIMEENYIIVDINSINVNINVINSYKSTQRKGKERKGEESIENNINIEFENFRKLYPGTKRGYNTEFDNFKKKHKDWKDVLIILNEKLQQQIKARERKKNMNLFVPEWKNLQTWINQRCWEDEIQIETSKPTIKNLTYG
jgi:hypothetical protein